MNRRRFLQQCGVAGAVATTCLSRRKLQEVLAANTAEKPVDGVPLPDEEWNLWIDERARWEDDELHLPESFDLARLPVHPPSGGWSALKANRGGTNAAVVSLPSTVEQHFWKRFGARPYTPDEYRYAADDPIPENGVYRGQVGDTRAPWMGNWLFVRAHSTFASLPADRILGVHYQAHGKASNGLLIERAAGAAEPEVIMGYSRDHDRKTGATSFACKVGATPVLVHRAPAFSSPLQQRWLANSIAFLTR